MSKIEQSPSLSKSLSQLENQNIQKLCFSRKVEHFQHLKQWDHSRAVALTLHRQLVDSIDQKLQEKIFQSTQYVQIVRQFVSDARQQQKKYDLCVPTNVESKMQMNVTAQVVYGKSSKHLWRLNSLFHVSQKTVSKNQWLLEQSLMRLQLLEHEGDKYLMEIRTKIQLSLLEIQNRNVATTHSCDNYIKQHQKNKMSRLDTIDVDLFSIFQEFIREAYLQTCTQKQLGCYIVQYLEWVEDHEHEKLKLVKNLVRCYLALLEEEAWGGHDNLNESLAEIMAKETDFAYIAEYFAVEELLSKELIAELHACTHKHSSEDIRMETLKRFLKKLSWNNFEFQNYLILKEYKIFAKALGDEEFQIEEIRLLVTADAFMNIYFEPIEKSEESNLEVEKCMVSLKIDHYLRMEKEGDIKVVLFNSQKEKERASGSHPFVKSNLILIFREEDQRQQFWEFMSKIMK